MTQVATPLTTPALYATSPRNGESSVSLTSEISFSFQDAVANNVDLYTVQVNGERAIAAGAAQPGWSIVGNTLTGSVRTIRLKKARPFDRSTVTVWFELREQVTLTTVHATIAFQTAYPVVSDLKARSYPGGKRVDLSWVNPAAATRIRIVRSTYSYPRNTPAALGYPNLHYSGDDPKVVYQSGGSEVFSVPDRGSNGSVWPAFGGSAPNRVTLRGRNSITFTGTDRLAGPSNSSSLWIPMHDATSEATLMWYQETNKTPGVGYRMFNTSNATQPQTGFLFDYLAGGRFQLRVSNNTGVSPVVAQSAVLSGQGARIFEIKKSANTFRVLRDGVEIINASGAGLVNTAPTFIVRVGSGTSGTDSIEGHIPEAIYWARGISNTERVRAIQQLNRWKSWRTEGDSAATILYEGTPITSFVDSDLEEGEFYYYTIFVSSDDVGEPRYEMNDDSSRVLGLSMRNYFKEDRHYVYQRWLPKDIQSQDSDPARGTDRFLLRRYLDTLQAGLNLHRGAAEALVDLRNADRTPAGQIGIAENQDEILRALVEDMGFDTEKTFDSGVLRRLYAGIVPIWQIKGTSQSFVDFTKLFTLWDSRAEELRDTVCGINRFFTMCDTINPLPRTFLNKSSTTMSDQFINPGTCVAQGSVGSLIVRKADVGPVWPTGPYFTSSAASYDTPAGIISDIGDFACVSLTEETTAPVLGDVWKFTFTNPAAFFRAELTLTGSGSASPSFTRFTATAQTHKAWQYAADGTTGPATLGRWGPSAFEGLWLIDSANNKWKIKGGAYTGTPATPTNYLLELDNTTGPANVAPVSPVSVATLFDAGPTYVDRVPWMGFRYVIGAASFWGDPSWDTRLLGGPPWSIFPSQGALQGTRFTHTPLDTIVWVKNQHEVIGVTTDVQQLELTDNTRSWTENEWAGFYVLPNWNQRRVYQIVSNTPTKLIVLQADQPGLSKLSQVGDTYVILSPENATKYVQLCKQLDKLAVDDVNVYVKFEEV